MRSPAARAGIAVTTLAAVVALFIALAGGDNNAATAQPQGAQATVGTQTARSATTVRQGAPAATARNVAKAPKPRIERIWVRGGKPAGGVRRFEFKRGDRVRFSVHSPTADEVHIHGFDITKALPANKIVVFAFPADIEGVFDVELHGAHTTIAELRVKP